MVCIEKVFLGEVYANCQPTRHSSPTYRQPPALTRSTAFKCDFDTLFPFPEQINIPQPTPQPILNPLGVTRYSM